MTGDNEREGGIALVLVIWAVTLLATIAVVISADGRAARRVASNLEQAAQARSLAEGGVWWGVVRLQETDSGAAVRVDGHVYPVQIADKVVAVVIEDESGKIDINHAAAPILQSLLQLCGASGPEARGIADAILAYRRQHAESSRAQTAAFPTTVDLRRLPAVLYEMFRCIEPAITVHSGSAALDPRTAPALALMAVPGLTPQLVQRYLAERTAGHAEGLGHAALIGRSEGSGYFARSPVGVVTVRATAQPSGGVAAHTSSAVVELRRGQQPPVLLHSWR